MSIKNLNEPVASKKIAILVPNPCNPDYRVIKHAELFARNGHEVRIYCRLASGLPEEETINGVMYIRKPITVWTFIIHFLNNCLFWRQKKSETLNRSKSLPR